MQLDIPWKIKPKERRGRQISQWELISSVDLDSRIQQTYKQQIDFDLLASCRENPRKCIENDPFV